MVKVITFGGEKGGIGKSTQVYNFSTWISAIKKEKVLLIDNDWRANLTATFQLTGAENGSENLYSEHGQVEIHKVQEYLDFIPANPRLREVGIQLEREKKRDYESLLLFWFEANMEKIEQYDWIFIDTHGDMEILTKNALVASHYEITPLEPSDWGYQAKFSTEFELEKLKEELYDRRSKTSLVTTELLFIGNKLDFRTSATHEFMEATKEDESVICFLPTRQIFSTSTLEKKPIVQLLQEEKYQTASYQKFGQLLNEEYTKLYERIRL